MQYSERLGTISNEQFQKALDAFDLGKFIKAVPITQGLFGQNVFVSSTKGEFVLRGCPYYDWQFKTEQYFVNALHEKTNISVPFPYLLNESTDIFGWEYIIMPRLDGINLLEDLSDNGKQGFLRHKDRLEIAVAQGEALKEAQKLTNPYCGTYDYNTQSIKPYSSSWIELFKNQIISYLEKSSKYNSYTPQSDIEWAISIMNKASEYIEEFIPTFFMQDYKPGNMVVEKNGIWKVTGLFDFMESSFGHPEADISRLTAFYIEWGRYDLAYTFINSYLSNSSYNSNFSRQENTEAFFKRFPLFMLHDRLIIWNYCQRTNTVLWKKDLTFREWITPCLSIDKLLKTVN